MRMNLGQSQNSCEKLICVKSEREIWNAKYNNGSHSSLEPDPFLVTAYHEYVAPLFPSGGQVLDIAGGVGRHAIWLAQRAWNSTLVDISDVGLQRAQKNAVQNA